MGLFDRLGRTKINEDFHPNGKLKTRTSYKSDRKHGKQTGYHEKGELHYESEWVDGFQN